MDDRASKMDDSENVWEDYKAVNKLFAEYVIKQLLEEPSETHLVWIHDYHLCLVPKLVKQQLAEKRPLCPIGFFLHIPFPTLKALEKIPHFEEILEGMLGSDSIGFHTETFRDNFLKCCEKQGHREVTLVNPHPKELRYQERKILVQVIPAGIMYDKFSEYSKGELSEPVKTKYQKVLEKNDGKKIFIGVERLDYTKGLEMKADAYLRFLEKYGSELAGEVMYLQIAVPCREDEPEYKNLKEKYKDLIKKNNERLEKDGHQKIEVIYESESQQDLSILYKLADVALVTPLIDGMNLVALEYVACQTLENPGVLVLSKYAGASEHLSSKAALKVDPYNIEEMADKMNEAITMETTERKNRMKELKKQVKEDLDVNQWIRGNLGSILRVLKSENNPTT